MRLRRWLFGRRRKRLFGTPGLGAFEGVEVTVMETGVVIWPNTVDRERWWRSVVGIDDSCRGVFTGRLDRATTERTRR